MQRYEKSVLLKSDCVIVCSEAERELLKLWGVHNALVVPNGVDTDFFRPKVRNFRSSHIVPHLLFIGAMDYFPNMDGIRWFLRFVVPELSRRMSSYKLTIVGRNPPVDLLAWQQPGRVEFTGFVDDVRPYASSADVFFVPLRIAAGTRLKILEALAMELPVVSTRVGAEGLEFLDRVHFRLVDTAREMADVVVGLCEDPNGAQEMARAACEKLRERYGWSAVTTPLCAFYEKELISQADKRNTSSTHDWYVDEPTELRR
jgi:glycosyltransferase involved in cell wall biosynthesis